MAPVKLKTENRPRFVVVGGAHMEIVMRLGASLPARGDVTCESAEMRPGGRAACTAAALAALRSRVTFITCLGADPFSGPILTGLSQRGINTSFIPRSASLCTGLVHSLIEPSGAARRVFSPGAAMDLTVRHIHKASVQFASADIVIVTPDIPRDTFLAALRLAHELGRPVIVDPSPADRVQPQDLAECDIVCADAGTAAALCGWEIRSHGDAQRCAARFLAQGAGAAAIDLAQRGVFTASGAPQVTCTPAPADASFDHPEARAAFNAGLAWALALGYTLSQAAWIAQSAAAAMDSVPSVLHDFPSFPGFDALIARQSLHIR